MNEEEDTQYLWMQEPERGFYVILCRQAPISSPALQTMGKVVLAMSLLSLVLSMMISGALTRNIVKPVSQLDKAMEKVKAGDLNIRVHSTRTDELGRLTDSFNGMVRDLKTYLEEKVSSRRI